MSNILPLPQPTLRLSAWGVLRETRSRSGKSQAVANRTMTSSHSPSDNEVSKSSHGRLHGTLSGVATEGPGQMPLYWLCYLGEDYGMCCTGKKVALLLSLLLFSVAANAETCVKVDYDNSPAAIVSGRISISNSANDACRKCGFSLASFRAVSVKSCTAFP